MDFEAAFRTAMERNGTAYREARQALISAPGALEFLGPRRASADWKTALTADILAGWIGHRIEFDQCTEYVQGRLPGRPPVTGSFVPRQRVAAITRLGKTVIPRLLEMAWKTNDWGDDQGSSAVFGALIQFKDPRTGLMLLELARPGHDPGLRPLAVATLGQLHDGRAVPELLALLHDSAEPEMLRATTAESLGALGADAAGPDLKAVLLDDKLDPEFRQAAARALRALGHPDAAPALLDALSKTHDPTLMLVLLDALGDVGGESSLGPLRKLEEHAQEDFIRQAARDAREKAEERLKAAKP